jgi:undecaprenyl-diphosphatase
MDVSLPTVTRVPALPGRGAVPCTFRQVRERWPLLIPLAVLVPLALGLAAMVDGGRLLAWDVPITAFAVDHRTSGWNSLALFVSRLGSWMVVFPVGAALALAARPRSRTLAMVIVVTLLARPVLEWAVKLLVARPRPDGARLVAGTGFSYPSGHVLAAAATWAFLPPVVALYTSRRAVWWAAVGAAGTLIGLIAWSRVWLGVHWTSDVVASLVLAFLALSWIEAYLDRAPSASLSAAASAGGVVDRGDHVVEAGDLDHPGGDGRDGDDAELDVGRLDLVSGGQQRLQP